MEEEWIVTKISDETEERYIAQPEGTNLVTNEMLLVSGLSKEEAVCMVSSIGNGGWFKYRGVDVFVHVVGS